MLKSYKNKKKILVTGGAGYIGSHTCIELLNTGYDVLILDNFSNSSTSVIKNIKKISKTRINYIQCDLRDLADTK